MKFLIVSKKADIQNFYSAPVFVNFIGGNVPICFVIRYGLTLWLHRITNQLRGLSKRIFRSSSPLCSLLSQALCINLTNKESSWLLMGGEREQGDGLSGFGKKTPNTTYYYFAGQVN